jgi:hypothetical protein
VELDRTTLQRAHCWFGTDRVPGDPAMTAYKREARYRQAMLREANGWPAGSHANTRKAIEAGGPPRIINGSKLRPKAGEAGANFLSDTIRAAVDGRLAYREDHETLDRTRLREDLLSSMPMCFNLFGELGADPDRARQAVDLLLPGARPGPVEVKFEWSPGRGSARYTNDRTAFDVAVLIGPAGGPRDFVGIETKYHEHAAKEPAPRPAARPRREQQTRFLVELANDAGVFKPGWQAQVLDTDLRQLWRDHLLTLAMRRQPEWSRGCYLLVYPSRNTSFAHAAQRYEALLADGDTTFRALTVEELLGSTSLHDPQTAAAFTHRYLRWLGDDTDPAAPPHN